MRISKRVNKISKILHDNYDEERGASETNIIDILADLIHYCDKHRMDFLTLQGIAERHFLAERPKKLGKKK